MTTIQKGATVFAARHFTVQMPHGYDPLSRDLKRFIRGSVVGTVLEVHTSNAYVQTDSGALYIDLDALETA